MATPLQFAYRTQKTIGIFNAEPSYQSLPGFVKPEGNLRCCAYSACGRFFAWASPEAVTVVSAITGETVTILPILNVLDLGFSPRGTYLITWERPGKDEAGDATKNLKVWWTYEEGVGGSDKLPLGRYVQKQGNWNLQYTSDEKFCARLVTNEVQFYESHNLGQVWNKLRVEGVSDFALAPGETHSVAVFVPEKKGQPAAIKVFIVPEFASPVSQKTFFKGDKVQLKWNKLGTSLLVLAQTEVDKSNKSYYGETTLYLLSANGGFDARVTLDKEGPIHDVTWSPNSKEFGIVYGFMPAKTAIINVRAKVVHAFAIAPRNTISFSPEGRFALVAGFGNLAGQIDIYDLEKDYHKVCTIESGSPSVCEWSPDSRFIMTATTSPRLRVDNGVKLWHVGGSLMYNEDMVELYNIMWRPIPRNEVGKADPLSSVPTPHESAATFISTIKAPSKPAGAYRPPGARGLSAPVHFRREDEGGAAHSYNESSLGAAAARFGGRRTVPGAEPQAVPGSQPVGDENLSKAALKRKKRKNKENEAQTDIDPRIPTGPSNPDARHRGPNNGHPRSTSRNPNGRGRNHRNDVPPVPNGNGNSNGNGYAESNANGQGNGDVANVANVANGANVANVASPDPAASAESTFLNDASSRNLKKLQKKLRAIEDLEMRYAAGEKLEDTQVKKINTKDEVTKELDSLLRGGGVSLT